MSLEVRGIVIHNSASRWGDAAAIDDWHKDRGWSGIGYHGCILNGVRTSKMGYDIALDGKIEPGRSETLQGAHCQAKGMNRYSIGVCCIGNPGWPVEGAEEAPALVRVRRYLTARQLAALVHYLAANCKQYDLDPLGTFKRPGDGKVIPVITQHSDHDPVNKPYCASLKLQPIREMVAAKLK